MYGTGNNCSENSMLLSASLGDKTLKIGLFFEYWKKKILLKSSSGNKQLSGHISTDFGNCLRISSDIFMEQSEDFQVCFQYLCSVHWRFSSIKLNAADKSG